jgi:hypothetical protein
MQRQSLLPQVGAAGRVGPELVQAGLLAALLAFGALAFAFGHVSSPTMGLSNQPVNFHVRIASGVGEAV